MTNLKTYIKTLMQDVSFAQRSRLRFECARLLRFARVVDLLIAETLAPWPCREISVTIFFSFADGRFVVGYYYTILSLLFVIIMIIYIYIWINLFVKNVLWLKVFELPDFQTGRWVTMYRRIFARSRRISPPRLNWCKRRWWRSTSTFASGPKTKRSKESGVETNESSGLKTIR